ncbi:MAG: hypothetical protein ACLU9T_18015 [Blautia faecis]
MNAPSTRSTVFPVGKGTEILAIQIGSLPLCELVSRDRATTSGVLLTGSHLLAYQGIELTFSNSRDRSRTDIAGCPFSYRNQTSFNWIAGAYFSWRFRCPKGLPFRFDFTPLPFQPSGNACMDLFSLLLCNVLSLQSLIQPSDASLRLRLSGQVSQLSVAPYRFSMGTGIDKKHAVLLFLQCGSDLPADSLPKYKVASIHDNQPGQHKERCPAKTMFGDACTVVPMSRLIFFFTVSRKSEAAIGSSRKVGLIQNQ